uniref:Centromere/kinetochore protein zw10 homolog n=1 Tax=Ornithorhynchus anatinus TaxID=9258 RepID=A0A6I8NUN5_ORNAN
MASFVTEVLAHSGRLEKEDLGTRIGRLARRVEEVKGEVCNMINKKYNEFLPSMQSAQELVTQVDELCGDVDLLKSRVENEVRRDLQVAISEFTELKQQLERDTIVLSVIKQLQEFDTAIEEYNCSLLEKKYIAAARHLGKAQSCLKSLKSRKGFELKILKALSVELTIQKQNILYHLGEEWQKLAVWKLPPSKEVSSLESVLRTEFHLRTEPPKEEEETPAPPIGAVLLALAILGELHAKLRSFSQLLLNCVLKPLVYYPSLHAVVDIQPDTVILRFESVASDLERPSPPEVFSKIQLVLEVLCEHLLNLPRGDDSEDDKTSKMVLAEILGDMIWEDMSECLIRDCLVYSIPTNSSKLEQYEKISPDCRVRLPDLPGLETDSGRKLQKEARAGPDDGMNLEPESKLGERSFSLPECRISESVEKLMALAYRTLLEATTSTEQCAVQLFYSVRNIFHLFHDVVPTYHKENLQKLPQLAAIHHNNCMYIAHHLLTLGHQFRGHLASVLRDGAMTFVDLVPGFRRLGTECFLAQMRAQKGELLERLSSARNFSNMDDEENYSAASKAIRQVLHQLKRLGMVWQDVLPVTVYCKAMGTLLSTALAEIIGRITALEDISTEDGDRLHSLCRTLVEEGPQVFAPVPDEDANRKYREEVPVYVPKWMAFGELMVMLQASLQEIGDRWADGKGPLADTFSSSEVKALIRALFQNTERRAAALAKIK